MGGIGIQGRGKSGEVRPVSGSPWGNMATLTLFLHAPCYCIYP